MDIREWKRKTGYRTYLLNQTLGIALAWVFQKAECEGAKSWANTLLGSTLLGS